MRVPVLSGYRQKISALLSTACSTRPSRHRRWNAPPLSIARSPGIRTDCRSVRRRRCPRIPGRDSLRPPLFGRRFLFEGKLMARERAGFVTDGLLGDRAVKIVAPIVGKHGLAIGRAEFPLSQYGESVWLAPAYRFGNRFVHLDDERPHKMPLLRKRRRPVLLEGGYRGRRFL